MKAKSLYCDVLRRPRGALQPGFGAFARGPATGVSMHVPSAGATSPILRRSKPRRISVRAPARGATVQRYSGRSSGRCFDPRSHAESNSFRYRCRKGQAEKGRLARNRSTLIVALWQTISSAKMPFTRAGRIEIRCDKRPLFDKSL